MKNNMKNKSPKTISLTQLVPEMSQKDRDFVETEKKYYHVVVALRKKRQGLGLTQEQLATISNIPRTTITRIESGSRNATIQTIMAMADAMGKRLELRLV